MAKELFFDFPTVDLLGNLQSSKKPIKSINNTDYTSIILFFDGVVLVGDLLDYIKTYAKYSNLSDEIKNNVNNIQNIPSGDPNAFKIVNTAFGRNPSSVSPLIINANYDEKNNKPDQTKTSTLILADISERDWFKKEYVGDDKAFISAAIKNGYKFIEIWYKQVLVAEIQLLLGEFSQKTRLLFSSVTTGGYVNTQRDMYNALIDVYRSLKEKAKAGNPELRKDFGAVFNLPNDPDPALPGPPTQAISGVTNKAPVVDNPNIKLPSQEVKSLTATSATDAIQQATPNVQVGPAISQAQGAASGAIGQAQGAASGAVSSVTDKLNPKGIKPDGLGKDWSPDKFSPESIAGNTKYVDPKTGQIGSTATLAKTLGATALGGGIGAGIGAIAGGGQGALIGGLSGGAIGAGAALGGIGGTALAGAGLGGGIGAVVGGGQAALIGAASGGVVGVAAAKLVSVQKDMPKPNISKPPNTPRIKTVKIPRPDSTKGAQALLNLPKSPTIL